MTFNKKVIYVLIVMLVLFCGLVCYFSYFQIFISPSLANAGANPRTYVKEQTVKRGSFYDRNGECLAYSEMKDGVQTRVYPFNRLYSQLIGYSHPRFGRTLLENTQNAHLLGSSEQNILDALLYSDDTDGDTVHLTVDNTLQQLAADLLGNRKGAIVAMEPSSGQILAMVSKPWFNPNNLADDWDKLTKEDGMFVPRATNGLYPPGSVFKIITAAAAVENMMDNETFEDTGKFNVGGYDVVNYDNHVYGTLDIDTAFAKSSNTYFAYLADKLGKDKLQRTAESFGFNKEITLEIPVSKSTLLKSDSRTNVASVGYGQGDTLTTPLHMAMVTSAIANDGVMMQPYLVSKITDKDGTILKENSSSTFMRSTSPVVAQRITEMMKACVTRGTGTGAQLSGITVAAKTGTAEVGGDKGDHAWFVAFAPAENPKIALSIVMENAGTTGSACAGMAARLIQSYLK